MPGIGLSPDKMLLGRTFAYNDAQRNRIGTNFHQLPVNHPKVPVHTYMSDGPMAYAHSGDAPVYAPNSGGRSWADQTGTVEDGWERTASWFAAVYARSNDDDFPTGHPGARRLQRRAAAEAGSAGRRQPSGGVREPVLSRAFDYWTNIDADSVAASRRRCAPVSHPPPRAWARLFPPPPTSSRHDPPDDPVVPECVRLRADTLLGARRPRPT